MKRTISIFLAALLFFGLLPVGAHAEGAEPTALVFGEAQTLDFIEFTMTKADLYGKLFYGTWYTQAPQGKQYIAISGPARNTSDRYMELGKIIGEVVIDDTYTFSMSRFFAESGSYKNTMEPLSEGTLYLYAEIPDELAESLTSASFRFGFNENLEEKPEKLEEAKYTYKADVSKGEDSPVSIDLHKFSPVKYKLKDELKAKSVKLTFTKKVAKKEVKLNYAKNNYYYYEAKSDCKMVGLQGTLTNTGKTPLEINLAGYLLIGDLRYEMNLGYAGNYRISPKEKTNVLLYVNVPESVLKKADSAKVYFGFNDELANGYGFEPEDCQYSYVYTLKFD